MMRLLATIASWAIFVIGLGLMFAGVVRDDASDSLLALAMWVGGGMMLYIGFNAMCDRWWERKLDRGTDETV